MSEGETTICQRLQVTKRRPPRAWLELSAIISKNRSVGASINSFQIVNPSFGSSAVLTTQHIARTQVMSRDNYRCFVSGAIDSSVYTFGRPLPVGVTRVTPCRAIPIIPPEVFAHESNAYEREREIHFLSGQVRRSASISTGNHYSLPSRAFAPG